MEMANLLKLHDSWKCCNCHFQCQSNPEPVTFDAYFQGKCVVLRGSEDITCTIGNGQPLKTSKLWRTVSGPSTRQVISWQVSIKERVMEGRLEA